MTLTEEEFAHETQEAMLALASDGSPDRVAAVTAARTRT
jgi:hypothetical protein